MTVALYDKLIATLPGVERKGATIPYTPKTARCRCACRRPSAPH
jgi:hypothetical protein